jgi:hypothetical protein
MIINLNKFVSINNFKLNFTKIVPGIYFLIWVDDNTQRWKRINGKYIPHKDGYYVIDHGFDLNNVVPRVLKYIGESTKPVRRLIDHYFCSEDSRSSGIGPKFTHIRIIKGFKRLSYDTIRLHHETLFVRKYLPDLNQASTFSENYRTLLKNSNGLLTPNDILKPHVLHARDIYRAYVAWEKEDQKYLDTELVKLKMTNKVGLIHPKRRDTRQYRNQKGEKIRFSRWVNDAVLALHKKQKEAITDWRVRMRKYIKLFNPNRYKLILDRDKIHSKNTYKRSGEFIRKSKFLAYRLKKNKNQQELI